MTYFSFILSIATFARFLYADNSISFDYQFYIYFFNELNDITIFELLNRVMESFPYVSWGDLGSGKFEFGFACIAYILGKLFNPAITYSMMASISVYIKLNVLKKFKVRYYEYFLFYIFDITIFESNQLRAGIALAIFMLLIYNVLNKNNKLHSLILILLSVFVHLSILPLILMLYIAKFIVLFNKNFLILIFLFLLETIAVTNLDFISSFFGGKVAEYNMLSNSFDVYNKTSGINIASILAATFSILFFTNRDIFYKKIYWIYGIVYSGTCVVLIVFSEYLVILSDRLWLLCLPIIILFYSHTLECCNFHHIKINFVLKNIIRIELFFYVVISLLYRYPSSNFFDFIVPKFEFIPPTLI